MSDKTQTADPVGRERIEVDEEVQSVLGEDISSAASSSLASETIKYEWRHGRRYHSFHAGQYSFPNDDTEQARLDMIHHVFYRTLSDRLFIAPIDPNGLTVLDIGTGTGLWATELGDAFPGATIEAVDLSPIQTDWSPPNVRFYVDDVDESGWTEPEKYDYIHCRYMAASIKDWPQLVKHIYNSLKPGGWVEFQESANTLYSEDKSLSPDNPMAKMMDHLIEACDKIGRTMDPAPSFQTWVKEAGFRKVEEQRFRLPIGGWPKDRRLKEIGTLMMHNFYEGVSGFTAVLFHDVLGWPKDDVEKFNRSVRHACQDRNTHPMFDFLVVTAQKPG